jgi:hypothetical protein
MPESLATTSKNSFSNSKSASSFTRTIALLQVTNREAQFLHELRYLLTLISPLSALFLWEKNLPRELAADQDEGGPRATDKVF